MGDVEKKLRMSNNKEEAGCTSNNYTFSPILSQSFANELKNNIDVVWDWHSPKSKARPLRAKVKIQSPKLLVKRHPSNEQISVFNKLEKELKKSTNKTSVNAKTNSETAKPDLEISFKQRTNLQDIFNDSMDEELIMCSQQVEHEVLRNNASDDNKSKPNLDQNFINVKQFKSNEIENDSFDCVLEALTDEDLKLKNSNQSENAREPTQIHSTGYSPIKCSPEEIEQKRLQAVAKLEAKRQEKVIERNRQEALKRLEISRKRRLFKID